MSTTTDPIADMLSRIRNCLASGKNEVNLPHSKIKESVANLLKANNFISEVKISDGEFTKSITLKIAANDKSPQITEIVRLSKPGRRQYVGANEIPVVKRGRGIVILSTSKGLMTGKQASAEHLGGELICRIY